MQSIGFSACSRARSSRSPRHRSRGLRDAGMAACACFIYLLQWIAFAKTMPEEGVSNAEASARPQHPLASSSSAARILKSNELVRRQSRSVQSHRYLSPLCRILDGGDM